MTGAIVRPAARRGRLLAWSVAAALAGLAKAPVGRAQAAASVSFGPSLTREMTPDERRWFDQWPARILRGVNAERAKSGRAACSRYRGEQPGTAVELTSEGIHPRNWTVDLQCPELRYVAVELRSEPCVVTESVGPKPRTRANGSRRHGASKQVLARGEHWMLVDSSHLGPRLFIGELVSSRATPSRGAAGVVDTPVCAVVSVVDPLPGKLSELIPPVAIEKALSAAVGPRPAPIPTAVEGPAPADPTLRQKNELEVYAFLLERGHVPRRQIVIEATRSPGRQVPSLTLVAPDLLPSLFTDFARLDAPTPFPATFSLPDAKVTLITREEQAKFFGKGRGGWNAFRAVYGPTGIVTFSPVGFSRDLSQAIVYFGGQSDWLAGGGSLYLLRRKGATWEVLYEVPLWVS